MTPRTLLALCVVQFYLLPSPPGQPPGEVQPFWPGGGELFEVVLSRGYGAGKIENNFFSEESHFLVDTTGPDRMERSAYC